MVGLPYTLHYLPGAMVSVAQNKQELVRKISWKMKFLSVIAVSYAMAVGAFLPTTTPNAILLTKTNSVQSSMAVIQESKSLMGLSQQTVLLSSINGDSSQQSEVDFDALVKYASAGVIQMGCFYALLNVLNLGVAQFNLDIPLWANALFFYACSLKSRALNPLNNQRPKVDDATGDVDNKTTAGELVRPSWFPPGVIFPIMWILIIGTIRAYSSALVIDSTGGDYVNLATLSFLLHLSVGDVWNTINNVEKRLGAAASGVVLVVLSAANAAYQYYQVNELAGELLGLTLLWLVTAGVLVSSIWQLNPIDSASGEKDALYPVKGSNVATEFTWFSGSNSN